MTDQANWKLVKVHWLDSVASGRWETAEDAVRKLLHENGGMEHLTVGWLIHEDEHAVVVAGSRHAVEPVVNDVMAIPWPAVLSIRELRAR